MHYFRVPRAYWGDRFAKMRAAGFNCVETVMCWNLHEPHEGEFCFGGGLDIAAYCRTAAEYGLYVIILTWSVYLRRGVLADFLGMAAEDHNLLPSV